MSTFTRLRVWLSALALATLLTPLMAQAAASVIGSQLVSSTRVGRTTFDYTYTITVQNGTPALASASANVVSNSPATQVVKGSVAVGDIAAGATLTSVDTFTLRQDRTVPFNPAVLVWTVTGAAAGPASLDIALSDSFVPPNGSVSVTPTLRDGNGTPISSAGYQFNVSVAPVGTVTGNAPLVSGLNVGFPKITKQLINLNPAFDPNGDYADTDPADPNFGRETGGVYRVSVTVAGTSLSSSRDVTVLPTGTAQITYAANQYAAQMGRALALAYQASLAGDTGLMAQAAAALQAVDANRDFSTTVLGTTSALAPPDGGLITAGLLAGAGFTAGSQDAAFATALANVVTRIQQAKSQVDATNVSALTQTAIDNLQAAVNTYKTALQALQALRTSTLGAYQQQDLINQALGSALPGLLDSIKLKSGQLLGVPVTVLAPAQPRYALAPRVGSPWLELGVPAVPFLGFAPPRETSQSAAPTLVSPVQMYAGAQPAQFFGFFSTMFSILTDLSGTARANIIELTITLANSLLNIELVNYINHNGPGGIGLDYCQGSASFSFVCPNYTPSRIGGSGFGRDPAAVKVAVLGCIDSNLLRNLATLRVPSNLAAGIRLANKVVSIAKSLQQDGGVAAVVAPDFIGEDDFGVSNDMMYFGAGFPRVNQGRLPCAGAIIVMNTRVGGLGAFSINALPSCG